MTISRDSTKIVPPVDVAPGVEGGSGRIDPQAMTIAQAAKVLSAVGAGRVTEDILRRHIEAGAPATADGRINLVHYAAWLNREDRHGD